jgi:replicative DNA helicase
VAVAVPPDSAGSVPPQNSEAENSVLGAILLTEQALDGVLLQVGLRPEDFYRPRHQLIFRSMIRLKEKAEPEAVDALTVSDDLRRAGELEEAGGEEYLHSLPTVVPAVGNVLHYARIVKDYALLRRVLGTSREIQDEVMSHRGDPRDLIERFESRLFRIGHEDGRGEMRSLEELLHREVDKLEELSKRDVGLTGTPSGFMDLDSLTGGFQRGNLIVLAARPSMGKSSLATNMAENAAVGHGKPVALFSLEMSETELAHRFIASQARVSSDELRKGRVKGDRWPKVLKAVEKLAKAPLYVDDSSDIGILEIRAKARRLHARHELGLIIVDYLQRLRPEGRPDSSRVEQVGQMSRGLKILARELDIPVIAVSQLSRAVESRHPPIPMLSDLRECVTGETLVTLADGRRLPIADLVGTAPEVLAVDERDRIVRARSDKVWRVGRRRVLRLTLASGRILRGTADHRVRTGAGWQTLETIRPDDRIALARRLPEPRNPVRWPDDRVLLLGHLIGDGSYLPHQPLRYTTASEESSKAVARAAEREFGSRVTRHEGRGAWQLAIAGNGNRWHPAGVGRWLRELGIWGQRSADKRVPTEAFRLAKHQIALLLRHLWATDGTLWCGERPDGRRDRHVSFATESAGLAADVAALLLRLGIVARITSTSQTSGNELHYVLVSDAVAQRRFLDVVGAFGDRSAAAATLREALASVPSNPNVDTLPLEIWDDVRRAMRARGVTQRAMAAMRGTAYGGTSHFKFSPSRSVLESYAAALENPALTKVADSELFWDRVVAVEPDGEEEVFDLTVPGPASWLADGVVTNNSGQVEQDADLVLFVYRDDYYNRESDRLGEADIILAKHRNGPIGQLTLTFLPKYPRFANLYRERTAELSTQQNGNE